MGGIHLIRTEYAAGSNHADRRLLLLHGTYLYRRGLGTKYDILINIERILLILGRMIRRNVQRFKVIVVILYFGTFHYFIAHTNENTLYFIQCNMTPECFDYPPKTPEVYNDATACVWRDGTWQLLEDTSKGFLLFVQSKSKEEAAA